jgi:hypothetical protein
MSRSKGRERVLAALSVAAALVACSSRDADSVDEPDAGAVHSSGGSDGMGVVTNAGGVGSYFGVGTLVSSCNVSDYQTPDVEIGPLPTNAKALLDSLEAHTPTAMTPTAPATSRSFWSPMVSRATAVPSRMS